MELGKLLGSSLNETSPCKQDVKIGDKSTAHSLSKVKIVRIERNFGVQPVQCLLIQLNSLHTMRLAV